MGEAAGVMELSQREAQRNPWPILWACKGSSLLKGGFARVAGGLGLVSAVWLETQRRARDPEEDDVGMVREPAGTGAAPEPECWGEGFLIESQELPRPPEGTHYQPATGWGGGGAGILH